MMEVFRNVLTYIQNEFRYYFLQIKSLGPIGLHCTYHKNSKYWDRWLCVGDAGSDKTTHD